MPITRAGARRQQKSRGRRHLSLAALLSLGTVLVAAQARPIQQIQPSQPTPPAADIAAALQRRYEAVKDFSASFTQTYEGAVLRRKAKESGTVYIKKPGMMRWEYTAPEKKLVVSDGRTLFMYFPTDRQVMKNPVPQGDEAANAVLFLMGKGDIVRDFNVRFGEGQSEASYVLRLEPRTRQPEYDWLQVKADRGSLQIQELGWGDSQGSRNTIALTNFKENAGLADKIFQFSIPRGTEVITSGKTP